MYRNLGHSSYQAMNVIHEENGNQLWLGDYTAAQDKPTLDKKGIRTVLTVACQLNIKYNDQNMNHKIYSILDSEQANVAQFFDDSFYHIKNGLKSGSVLVHCAAGVSRSASIVIAYLMRNKGWTYSEAFSHVKSKRFVICPNSGFQRQLKLFEKQLRSPKENEKQSNQKESDDNQVNHNEKEIEKPLDIKKSEPQVKIGNQVKQEAIIQNEFRQTLKNNDFLGNASKQETKTNFLPQNINNNRNCMLTTKFINTRTNIQQNKINLSTMQTSYNSSYAGPQIVTHAQNKLFEKQALSIFPGIQAKSNLINYTMNNRRNQ
ncbi:unnamed protein product (macronuclear) [Paramecium tetraurelia]|uniref:protein-tyrosine-phosphatase n=1 Tax=Paramecium tetraurelia TaxID=5888 RepID=A0E9J2_PARTE|nr:uncharacterized protein GSPATT00024690001 [Paramecium tetraurelia]CAK91959.1 unnamed protein product [Paramecium tetraurelia]|eukprot:XP_001459356.1 hypothetical protein (macronuclear) [Paramecium tetraurelia strain d4-2]